MSFFCLLWVPLFYLLRRSFWDGKTTGGVWALLLGSITAIIQFFTGDLISPGGFGFSRWLFGFVDIVSLPVVLSLVIYLIIIIFQGNSSGVDFANFALLWLIPIGALRALSWSSGSDPIMLVMAPILWTALAAGIPFFINRLMDSSRWYTSAFSILCILALPAAAAAVYWAFFAQQTWLGFALLAVTNVPLVLSFTQAAKS
ncbi:MAG: hypothetical protein LBI28_06630 [Treponema sp.]|jgi:hypothetical protein|nr:hypothetical protein [Treponema sp.]